MPPTSAQPRLTAAQQEDLERMSLLQHLEELRKRVFWSLLALVVALIPCGYFYRQIFRFLVAPLERIQPGLKLSFLALTDPFILYFKMALLTAVFLASPFLLYQLWRFISPGLYSREKKMAIPFIFFTTLFFVSGGAFGYYVAFPMAAQFLLGLGTDMQAVITADKYFGFLLTVLLGLGLMFELPVLILLLSLLGVVTPRFLLKYFRHAVVIIFIAAAIITPTPDIVNLCVFAVPALGLYMLGIAAAFVAERFRKKREAAEAAE
ncbi:MAG TPA: twin-arginine translocase subunit TatC [Thermoanaerobaculia bacterium]